MTTTIVRDQQTDANHSELVKLSELYEFPEFVKSADLKTGICAPPDTSMHVFADPKNRQYPCHTKAATWLSYVFFLEKQAELSRHEVEVIGGRLDKNVDYWNLRADVSALKAKKAGVERDEFKGMPDSDFAFVQEIDGQIQRHFPLRNALETKAAAAAIRQHQDTFPFAVRNVMAQKIRVKAAQYGASLGEHENYIERQAGEGCCSPNEVIRMLDGRQKLVKTAAQRDEWQALIDVVRNAPRMALSPDMLIKLATVVDAKDRRELNLVGKYSNLIPRPEDVIFGATYKEAQADVASLCSLTTGSIYKRADLEQVGLRDLESVFGTEFMERVRSGLSVDTEKLAELAETFPRPEAETLELFLRECGIHPYMTQQAGEKSGFSRDEYTEAAAAYAPS